MVWSNAQSSEIWALVAAQHGVITRAQLLERGVSRRGIEHRLAIGKLRIVYPGVYVVGRPELSREGRWMAAVLACGDGALLSHGSAAALWGIGVERNGEIEVSVEMPRAPRVRGIRVHRRQALQADDRAVRDNIPVTCPTRTVIDLALRVSTPALERMVNDADKLDLIDPEQLRADLDARAGQPGVRPLRNLLDRTTFTLTDSELERRFIPIAKAAGLPPPLTQQRVNGFRVDFYWPDLGLVVETDGLRYHRTPTQQSRDSLRDHAHAVAGMKRLRFTHAQIRHQPAYVQRILRRITSKA
jgi:hypothetical protein